MKFTGLRPGFLRRAIMSKWKWNKYYNSQLSKAVKSFNRKIDYYTKKGIGEYLPDKVKVSSIKQRISSPEGLSREINALKSFNKSTAIPVITDQGIKTTKYQIEQLSQRTEIINQRRNEERERLQTPELKGTMGTIKQQNLQPRNININTVSMRHWKKFIEGIYNQTADDYIERLNAQYKANFLAALDEAFGSKAWLIKDIVGLININDLAQMLYDDPILSIDFIYGEEEQDLRIGGILNHLYDYMRQNNITLDADLISEIENA